MYVRSSGRLPDRGLVRLEVEHEVAVLDDLGSGAVSRPPAAGGAAGLRARLGWNGERQKSSNRSSRSSSSPSCAPETSRRIGSSGASRLRSDRQIPNAPSGSSSAHDHRARPAVGRLVLGGDRRVGDRLPRVAGEVERLRQQRRRRVREDEKRLGDGPTSSQRPEVAVDLPGRDLRPVVGPLAALVADEVARRRARRAPRRRARTAPSRRRPRRASWGRESMPSAARSSGVISKMLLVASGGSS